MSDDPTEPDAGVGEGSNKVQPSSSRTRARTIPREYLQEVERRILSAQAPADFVADLATGWARSERQVWKYVAVVRKRLAARAKLHDPDADRELIRAMLLESFTIARTGGPHGPDTKGMVQAAKTLADVTGVTAPKKIDVTSGGEKIATVVMLPALEDVRTPGTQDPLAAESGSPDEVPRE